MLLSGEMCFFLLFLFFNVSATFEKLIYLNKKNHLLYTFIAYSFKLEWKLMKYPFKNLLKIWIVSKIFTEDVEKSRTVSIEFF